ncbi:MAG: fatty acid--CoA ligase family protein [Verrucomicrobia bacterium]|nr:fatty acid--CoA ligase family protein [Verrucomicrobiota bacterium]
MFSDWTYPDICDILCMHRHRIVSYAIGKWLDRDKEAYSGFHIGTEQFCMGLLYELWERVCADRGNHVAVHDLIRGCSWTFGEIRNAVLKGKLDASAVVPCETGNSVDFIVTFLTACRHGRVFMPLERSTPAVIQQRIIQQFTDIELPAGTAMLKLTSGSTGQPKGIALSESNLVADVQHICRTMDIRSEDLNLATISVAHSYGFDNLVLPLIVQGTPMVLLDSFLPRSVLDAIARYQVSVVPLVPFMYDSLAALEGNWSSVRTCISAGAMLSPEVAARFHAKSGRKIHTFYGSSECGGICFDHSHEPVLPAGCVGTPLDSVRVSLDDTQRVCVQGLSVALGYVSAHAEDTLCDGRFLTSDLGKFDSLGRLLLTGRVAGVINIAGQKVHPAEVERCLLSLHGVKAAAVVGLPEPSRGEAVGALVVAEKLDEAAILQHCHAHLAAWKVPHRLKIVSALPYGDRDKLSSDAVRALLV